MKQALHTRVLANIKIHSWATMWFVYRYVKLTHVLQMTIDHQNYVYI